MSALRCVFLLFGSFPLCYTEKHSLYYIYTGLSKSVDLPGIYEFTAMGLLDDRQIDYYNSKDQRRIPKQTWMKDKMPEDYWEKGTESRKRKEQWFNRNINILMNRMRYNDSDLHVLQWRVGCETKQYRNEKMFSKGIFEVSYDGENFLSFDAENSQWVATVDAAVPTKRKWEMTKLNESTRTYLEMECADWLYRFTVYADEEFRKGSPPQVHVFAVKSIKDDTKMKLSCLATGFFPKDVMLVLRKYLTSLPEDEIESTGVRPNHDGSFQMRKSVEIREEEQNDYDCYVAHRTLKEPIITKWGRKWPDPYEFSVRDVVMGAVGGGLIVVVVGLAVMALMYFILKKKSVTGRQRGADLQMVNLSERHEASSPQEINESDVETGKYSIASYVDSGEGSACSLSSVDDST